MTARKSFLIIFRVVFVLCSFIFLKDAFYKWDGHSYYMRFIEFLPDLSLAFVLWTVPGVILAFFLWLMTFILFKSVPDSFIIFRLENLTFLTVFVVLPLFTKRVFFFYKDIAVITGLSYVAETVLWIITVGLIVWICYKNEGELTEKALSWIDSHITPIVWLFAFLFLISIPLSVIDFRGSNREIDSVKSVQSGVPVKKMMNIIMITMDTLTSVDMQGYGYERPTTPFISKWAKKAVVFKKFYASSNWTVPTSMSIMTGQRVWTHGIWFQAKFNPVYKYEYNFPKLLKDKGYAVYAFIQNAYAHPDTIGIGDAFIKKDTADTFWLNRRGWFGSLMDFFVTRPLVQEWIFRKNSVAKLIHLNNPQLIGAFYAPAEKVYDSFLDYISETHHRNGNPQPFFAWLHTYPPHEPYVPPEPFMGMFENAEFNISDKKLWSKPSEIKFVTSERMEELDKMRKRYDEFITYSDKQFELFMTRLSKTIDLSNTIIILSSDHGESFMPEHRGHTGPYLYSPLVDLPLIIKMPGNADAREIDTIVDQIDIAPTILELAGIAVPDWMEGRSLVSALNGMTLDQRPAFSMQLIENRSFGNSITRGTIAVWDGDYKLIHYLDKQESLLFNLKLDPDETINIFNEMPEVAERLKKLIYDNLSKANKRITKSYKK